MRSEACGQRKTAMEDTIGKSVAFTSHHATLAEVVCGSGDGAGKTMYRSHSMRGILGIPLLTSLCESMVSTMAFFVFA